MVVRKLPLPFAGRLPRLDGGEIEMLRDGLQTRSFLYIEECLRAIRKFMDQE